MSVSLDTIDIETYLRVIFTGIKVISVEGVDLIMKHPSNLSKIKANFIYDKYYSKALKDGLLPRAELEELIDKRNIISPSEKKEMEDLAIKIGTQRAILDKTIQVGSNPERVQKIIADMEKRLEVIKSKRWSKLFMSADVKAEEQRYNYLCYSNVYSMETNELYWPTYDRFINDSNFILKQKVIDLYIEFNRGIATKIIRFLARSNLWRIRYNTSIKTGEALLGVPTSDYTDDMLNLVFWSNYYQNIYEMFPEDRPQEAIINDDKALDAFMTAYYEERDKETLARKGSAKLGGYGGNKLSAFKEQEVIVTQSSELYKDLKYDKPKEAQRVKNKPLVFDSKSKK